MTLEAAATEFDMSAAQLSRIETAKSPYTQDLLELAAVVYKTDILSLLFRDPTNQNELWDELASAMTKKRA